MEDEKYPETLSSIHLNDIKQVKAVVANLLGTNMPSAVEDSDMFQAMVTNFLSSVGENIFALANQQRQSTCRKSLLPRKSSVLWADRKSDSSIESLLMPITSLDSTPDSHEHYQPEFKIRQKFDKKLEKSIHRLSPGFKLPPLISVPSHKIEKRPPAKKRHVKADLAKPLLVEEKRKHAARQRAEIRARELEASIAKADHLQSLSRRWQHEKRLMLETNLAKMRLDCDEKRRIRAKAKVIVVGAGLAGVSAAEKLISLGFKNTIVLEASKRVGGRIHSIQFGERPDHLIELGAPAVEHVEESNSVYELARDNDLLIGSREHQSFQSHVLRVVGREIDQDITGPANLFCKSIAKDVDLLYRFIKSSTNNNINLAYDDYLRERRRRLVNQMNKDFVERLPDISQAVKAITNNRKLPFGDSTGTVAADLLGYYRDMGDVAVCKKLAVGMSALFEPLTKNFKEDTIKFNSRVDNVDWSEVTKKNTDETGPQIRVACSDGRIFQADHVIMAVPVGHLKQNLDRMFKPNLPEDKEDAVRRIGFGVVSKVFLYYETPFWSDPINLLWAGSSRTQSKLSSHTIKVATMPLNPNVLEVSLLGDTLENMEESQIALELKKIFGMYLKKEIPDPTAVKRTSWHKNPLFCGSHPFLSTQCLVQDLAILEQSVTFKDRPVILFAGDYTYKHYRCLTHSARASGIREAVRLANFYNPLYGFENTTS